MSTMSARTIGRAQLRSSTASVRKPLSSRPAVPVGLKSSALSRPAKFKFATRAEAEPPVEVKEQDVAAKSDLVDPADGSVAYGAPLGDKGTQSLEGFMSVFSNPRSIEIINGRAAMIGFASALFFEVTKQVSLVQQVFNIRTFTLLDGNQTTTTYPGGGFYLAFVTALAVVAASYIPKAKGVEENGLDKEPGENMNFAQMPRFNAEIEMFNGRAAMIGLVALAVTEAIIGHAEF